MTALMKIIARAISGVIIAGSMMPTMSLAEDPTNLSESYESWSVQCQQVGAGEQRQRLCQMSQELVQNQTRQRVLTFVLSFSKEGTIKGTVIAPFGLLLSEGLRVEMDGKEVARGAFRTCLPLGCISEVDLSQDAIKQLSVGAKASVMTTANTGQPVRTDITLSGFSAAYRRLSELIVQ
ncbi:invasion associated locus B family protein [Ciceribacter sp. RN22]|uniref:invasion associated locus B family protein n=1 Tax=Ciceribacter sp. RN22 TaxID=2954932 RepID=UPI00209358B7|nr:invasion associated locus B family protein [Ciceribacter sp. RN22]MCO6177497.1 invasion associated locus B family protein [Ciceribacter sp. RN22]